MVGSAAPSVEKYSASLCRSKPGVGPDNAVFAAVIPGRAMKNMHSNLLFRGRFGRAFERAVSNVKKKFPEA